mmetsp:Transcript_32139/g.31458  ORF Transcript_32139/g.31458 Transcript_32139/m.31458 type:complete len:141 (+) Transcript_32139:784-1206(+)
MLDPLTNTIITNNMIIEKLLRNLKTRNMTIFDLCRAEEDEKSKFANIIEFKNSLRKIGVNSREMDRILDMVVVNRDGLVDLDMFSKKLHRIEEEEELIEQRNDKRLDTLKKIMYEKMTSPEDAFRYFDKDYKGKLTYFDF